MEQLGGVPRLVRTDKGTENIWISVMQRLLRMDQNDNLAGFKSFIEGKSSAKQRIESYWSKLRQGYLFIYLASPQGQGHHNSVSQLLWARIT